MPVELTDPEDLKIVALARSARARTGAQEGSCVRDTDGRTYVAATVDLSSLHLTAAQLAVAMAASSGAAGLEAVAVVGEATSVSEPDLAVARDFAGTDVTFMVAATDGSVHCVETT